MDTAKEFIKYLSEFPQDSKVSVIIANPDADSRKLYPIEEFYALTKDEENKTPCFIICVGKPGPLDEFTADKNGQLKFTATSIIHD